MSDFIPHNRSIIFSGFSGIRHGLETPLFRNLVHSHGHDIYCSLQFNRALFDSSLSESLYRFFTHPLLPVCIRIATVPL